MVKCYKCKEEIRHLVEYNKGWVRYDFFIAEDGTEDYLEREPMLDDLAVTEYECPMCNKVLFSNMEDALRFLRGELDIPVFEKHEDEDDNICERCGEPMEVCGGHMGEQGLNMEGL